MVLAHPRRGKRDQRKPEEQVEIGPEDRTVDALRGIKHVMMIVPVNADIHKAQKIAYKDRQHRQQIMDIISMRNMQFQDHDRNDDRKYAIAKSLQTSLFHAA